jgi:hypothetical protein
MPSEHGSFRYKYLQKPLEESALPTLLQYINRLPAAQKDKLATTIGIMLSRGLATARCLLSLTKDHLVKDGTLPPSLLTHPPWNLAYCLSGDVDVAADVITIVFRTYISEHSIDHLATTLKKGGVRDLLLFFPPNKRQDKILDDFFRKRGLGQVADWWTKKQYAILKDEVTAAIKDRREQQEHHVSNEDVRYLFLGVALFWWGINDQVVFARLWQPSGRSRRRNLCRKRNSYSAFGPVWWVPLNGVRALISTKG